MGERSAGNPHAAFDVEGTGDVARSKLFGLNRRASPRPYLGAPGGEIPPGDSTRAVKLRVRICFRTAPDSGHCQKRVSLFSEPSRIADHCVLGPSNSTPNSGPIMPGDHPE